MGVCREIFASNVALFTFREKKETQQINEQRASHFQLTQLIFWAYTV